MSIHPPIPIRLDASLKSFIQSFDHGLGNNNSRIIERMMSSISSISALHYAPIKFSSDINIVQLTKPLILVSSLNSTSSSYDYTLNQSSYINNNQIKRSSTSLSSSTSNVDRDILLEVGCDLSLLRMINLAAGSLIQIQSSNQSTTVLPSNDDNTRNTIIARIHAVDIKQQTFIQLNSSSSSIPTNSSIESSDAQSFSSSLLLLPPSLLFYLFPPPLLISNITDSYPSVRIRRFSPLFDILPSASAAGLDEWNSLAAFRSAVTTLHPSIMPTIPTAMAVTLRRIASPISNAVANSKDGCVTQLASFFASPPLSRREALLQQTRSPSRSRIMPAGMNSIIAVPAILDSRARKCWLLDGQPFTSSADMDEDDELEDGFAGEAALLTAASPFAFNSLPAISTAASIPLIYFRIVSVSPSHLSNPCVPFIIDPQSTQLTLLDGATTTTAVNANGTISSLVPYALEAFILRQSNHHSIHNSNINPISNNRLNPPPVPPHSSPSIHSIFGLSEYLSEEFGKMRSMMMPALHQYYRPSDVHHQSFSTVARSRLPFSLLLTGGRRSHKRMLVSAVSRSLGIHYLEVNAYDILSDAAAVSMGNTSESVLLQQLSIWFERARLSAPCILHVRRLHAFKSWLAAQQKETDIMLSAGIAHLLESITNVSAGYKHSNARAAASTSMSSSPILFVASADSATSLPSSFLNLFLHTFPITNPNLHQRQHIVRESFGDNNVDSMPVTVSDKLMSVPLTAAEKSVEEIKQDNTNEKVEKIVNNDAVPDKADGSTSPSSLSSSSASPTSVVYSSPSLTSFSSLVASRTAGANAGDVEFIVACATKISRERTMKLQQEAKQEQEKLNRLLLAESSTNSSPPISTAASSSSELQSADFDVALSAFNHRFASLTGVLSSPPNVRWDDIGGLYKAKEEIMQAIELPLQLPHLFGAGTGVKKRAGLLLYGPPGTGKTMVAKAVATECGLNFMSVKGPELLNMYIGESERNIRDVFSRARAAKPVVVFFDELDALAPARGQGSDSGGVMDRVVSALLAELDSVGKGNDGVFLIAATNRPDLLEQSLLRPGRLDRCVYLGLAKTHEDQLPILRALTRKFDLSDDVDLLSVVQRCPFTMSGADFYALASDALLLAIKRKITEMETMVAEERERRKQQRIQKQQNDHASIVHPSQPSSSYESKESIETNGDVHTNDVATMESDPVDDDLSSSLSISSFISSLPSSALRISVVQQDFLTAQSLIRPSLSEKQLERYEQLRKKFGESNSNGGGGGGRTAATGEVNGQLTTHHIDVPNGSSKQHVGTQSTTASSLSSSSIDEKSSTHSNGGGIDMSKIELDRSLRKRMAASQSTNSTTAAESVPAPYSAYSNHVAATVTSTSVSRPRKPWETNLNHDDHGSMRVDQNHSSMSTSEVDDHDHDTNDHHHHNHQSTTANGSKTTSSVVYMNGNEAVKSLNNVNGHVHAHS